MLAILKFIYMLLAVHTHTRERHDGVLCVLFLDCGGEERKKCKLKKGIYVYISIVACCLVRCAGDFGRPSPKDRLSFCSLLVSLALCASQRGGSMGHFFQSTAHSSETNLENFFKICIR